MLYEMDNSVSKFTNQLKTQIMAKSSKAKSNSSNGGKEQDNMLQDFFGDEIKDIYWAEKNLIKALTKMSKAATTKELQKAFITHRGQTEQHITRLEQVFELLGKKPVAKKCEAMNGIIKEGAEIIEETEKGTATRDVALIMAAQKAEHYEIATYGGLATLAKALGLNKVADILYTTLEEEKKTDELLTGIAENNVNYEASSEKE